MKLYHYTNNKNVLKEGLKSWIKHEDTEIINNLIEKFSDDLYSRDDCIFLSFKKSDLGDIIISVNSESLNKDLLFVANQDLANEIYSNYYYDRNNESIVKNYIKSIVSFKDYNGDYENPEIIYQDSIPLNLLKLEDI